MPSHPPKQHNRNPHNSTLEISSSFCSCSIAYCCLLSLFCGSRIFQLDCCVSLSFAERFLSGWIRAELLSPHTNDRLPVSLPECCLISSNIFSQAVSASSCRRKTRKRRASKQHNTSNILFPLFVFFSSCGLKNGNVESSTKVSSSPSFVAVARCDFLRRAAMTKKTKASAFSTSDKNERHTQKICGFYCLSSTSFSQDLMFSIKWLRGRRGEIRISEFLRCFSSSLYWRGR